MNDHLQHWLRQRNRRQVATIYLLSLDRFERLPAVCEVMFHLNRRVRDRKRTPFTQTVYSLKNQFIEHLYRAGYCVAAERHYQQLKCWCGCSAWCEKCDGTGIYRETTLYYFKFDLGDRCYVWHQPAALVTWPITLTTETIRELDDRISADLDWPLPFDVNQALQVVNMYLQWYGMGRRLPSLASVLREIAGDDLRRRSLRLRRWLALHLWPEVHESDIDEIPF